MGRHNIEVAVHRLNAGFATRVSKIAKIEAAECGLASLALVASHYGNQLSVEQ
jgi:hypothetical protein